MDVIIKLNDLLTLSANSDNNEITGRIPDIAKLLIESCAIKRESDIYLFSDIEFYFYNQHHKDIITHPRNCNAMQWYVNDFGGIDLTFQSEIETEEKVEKNGKLLIKPVLNKNSYFGGILIRKLKNAKTGYMLSGPLACAELFRLHNALGTDSTFPSIIAYETGQSSSLGKERHNLKRNNQTTEAKVSYLLSAYANTFSQSEKEKYIGEFDKFQKASYHYYAL